MTNPTLIVDGDRALWLPLRVACPNDTNGDGDCHLCVREPLPPDHYAEPDREWVPVKTLPIVTELTDDEYGEAMQWRDWQTINDSHRPLRAGDTVTLAHLCPQLDACAAGDEAHRCSCRGDSGPPAIPFATAEVAEVLPVLHTREAAYVDPRIDGHERKISVTDVSVRLVDHREQSDTWLLRDVGAWSNARFGIRLTNVEAL